MFFEQEERGGVVDGLLFVRSNRVCVVLIVSDMRRVERAVGDRAQSAGSGQLDGAYCGLSSGGFRAAIIIDPLPEYRRSNADMGRAQCDGLFEIAAHPHRQSV
jgi:hypothetical protein